MLSQLLPFLEEVAGLSSSSEQWLRIEAVLARIDELAGAGRDLSPALVFLALSLGHLTASVDAYVVASGGCCLSPYFALVPSLQETPRGEREETQEEDDAVSDFFVEETPEISDDDQSEESLILDDHEELSEKQHLQRFCFQVFGSLGVTRRERERMEAILELRLKLFSFPADLGRIKSVLRSYAFDEALLLVWLTGFDEQNASCFQYWADKREQGLASPAAFIGRPRRRRSRRRGGRGANQQGELKKDEQ